MCCFLSVFECFVLFANVDDTYFKTICDIYIYYILTRIYQIDKWKKKYWERLTLRREVVCTNKCHYIKSLAYCEDLLYFTGSILLEYVFLTSYVILKIFKVPQLNQECSWEFINSWDWDNQKMMIWHFVNRRTWHGR